MIRAAKNNDIPEIIEYLEPIARQYEHLTMDMDKTRFQIRNAIASSQHYCGVVDNDGIDGVLIAVVQDHPWARKRHSHIVCWHANQQGGALMRDFKRWLSSRAAVRFAEFTCDLDIDHRVYSLLRRLGFEGHGVSYLLMNTGRV